MNVSLKHNSSVGGNVVYKLLLFSCSLLQRNMGCSLPEKISLHGCQFYHNVHQMRENDIASRNTVTPVIQGNLELSSPFLAVARR
jgi:hypothetical protein